VNEEETLELTAYESVDTANGASAFFYWCADGGEFEYDEGSDFRMVRFVAPFVSADENVSIRAKWIRSRQRRPASL